VSSQPGEPAQSLVRSLAHHQTEQGRPDASDTDSSIGLRAAWRRPGREAQAAPVSGIARFSALPARCLQPQIPPPGTGRPSSTPVAGLGEWTSTTVVAVLLAVPRKNTKPTVISRV